jgi:hypothetical protein
MYHFLLLDARCIPYLVPENSCWGRFDPWRERRDPREEFALLLAAADETVGGGETRERGALNLRLSECVAGEDEGRLL